MNEIALRLLDRLLMDQNSGNMNQDKLWTKNFIIVSFINFLVFLIHLLLMVSIASYAIERFQAAVSTAGLVASIFIIGALIGRFSAGRVISDLGSKSVLGFGTIFFVVVLVLYFMAVSLPLLILVRLLHGMAHGVVSTATGTIVAQTLPQRRRGEGIGYYGLSIVMASAIGPFIGILLIQLVDFKTVFLFTTLLAAASLGISFLVQAPAQLAPQEEEEKKVHRFHLSNFFEFKSIPISVIALIVGFSCSVIIAFISIYTRELRLEKAAGLYFVVSAVATLVTRPIAGRLLDIRGDNFVVYPCLLIYALGMFLFSQANHGIFLVLAGALVGIGYGNFMSSAQTIALSATIPRRFGLATATYYVFLDFGIGVGPYLLGLLVPYTGYRGLYVTMAILALATVPLYYLLHGKKAPGK